jgi:ferrous iron transport protein A
MQSLAVRQKRAGKGYALESVTMSAVQPVPLESVTSGSRVIVRGLGEDSEMARRLMVLGLALGASAEILQNYGGGPLLVRARNTLIAIGRSEAQSIFVEVKS